LRTFIAIDIPGDIKDRIVSAAGELDKYGARPAGKETIHVTLCFIGEIGDRKAEEVKGVMRTIDAKGFKISLKGIGTFNPHMPRVVFAEIEEGRGELKKIYSYLKNALEDIDVELEEREFSPHVTIARIANPRKARGEIGKFLRAHASDDFGSFYCKSICLKKSAFAQNGVFHTTIFEKPLDSKA
jgi:RNA 2',3'-cyclic 3'-phosphodiesterase